MFFLFIFRKKNHYFGLQNQKLCFFLSKKNQDYAIKFKKKNVFRTLFLVESCFRICANKCWHRFPKSGKLIIKMKKKYSIFDANPGKWAYSAYAFLCLLGFKTLLKYLSEKKWNKKKLLSIPVILSYSASKSDKNSLLYEKMKNRNLFGLI